MVDRGKRVFLECVDSNYIEDRGKLQDTKLTESFQRMIAALIKRMNGEGNDITGRKFGDSFNRVTLNGRQKRATT